MNNIESKFTAWMKVLVKRARLDYLRKKYIQSREIFFEDLEGWDTRYVLKQLLIFSEPSIDLFENEELANIFNDIQIYDFSCDFVEKINVSNIIINAT